MVVGYLWAEGVVDVVEHIKKCSPVFRTGKFAVTYLPEQLYTVFGFRAKGRSSYETATALAFFVVLCSMIICVRVVACGGYGLGGLYSVICMRHQYGTFNHRRLGSHNVNCVARGIGTVKSEY